MYDQKLAEKFLKHVFAEYSEKVFQKFEEANEEAFQTALNFILIHKVTPKFSVDWDADKKEFTLKIYNKWEPIDD